MTNKTAVVRVPEPVWPEEMESEFEESVDIALADLRLDEEEYAVVITVAVGLEEPSTAKEKLLPALRLRNARELSRPEPDTRAFLLGSRAAVPMMRDLFGKISLVTKMPETYSGAYLQLVFSSTNCLRYDIPYNSCD